MTDFHHSQRAMRALRRTAMQRGTLALLDIGTFKVTCLILKFADPAAVRPDAAGLGPMAARSAYRVIGAGTTRSRGVRFGEIAAMAETERAVRTVLKTAQAMAQARVDHAILCFAGGGARSYGLDGEVELETDEVRESDIARCLAACDVPDLGQAREVLHAQPVNFVLDHRSGLSDPRGQAGRRLGCDLHLLSVNADVVHNLVQCLKRCDVEVAGLAASAYVSGLAALVEDEQELGAACIDMGAGTTGISIFIKKHMIYADTVRLGGDHVTMDIAKALHVPMSEAERVKTRYGGVQATGRDDREVIPLDTVLSQAEREHPVPTRHDLIGVMRPRVEEILEEVRARLDAAGFDHLPSQQIVLTGGGSQIPGLDGLAARYLGSQVRLGRPLRVPGLPQAATGPAFSALVGLCQFAAAPQDEWWDFEMPTDRLHARPLRRALRWFKDNW